MIILKNESLFIGKTSLNSVVEIASNQHTDHLEEVNININTEKSHYELMEYLFQLRSDSLSVWLESWHETWGCFCFPLSVIHIKLSLHSVFFFFFVNRITGQLKVFWISEMSVPLQFTRCAFVNYTCKSSVSELQWRR